MTNVVHSKFWRLSLGLLFFGIGQRLMFTGIVLPWATDTSIPIVSAVLSLVSVLLGFILIIPIGIWFYKNYRSDKRLHWAIVSYILSVIVCALGIGAVGQLIYDYTSFAYTSVKTGIWIVSTIVQLILKIILCFVVVSIHRKLPLKDRMSQLWLPLLLSIGLTAVVFGITIWLPMASSFIVSVADLIILIFTLYYFMYLAKESIYETVS